jgi:hypothetical protein
MEKWLKKHWLGIAALAFSAVWFYTQLLQWRKHGDDYMFIAFNLLFTFVLWLTLVFAIARYWRSVDNPRPWFRRKPKAERLTVRITEGYFGRQQNDAAAQLVLLNVKVDGVAATIKSWELEIERQGKHWQTGWRNPINDKSPSMVEPWTELVDYRWARRLVEFVADPIPLDDKPIPLPDVDTNRAKVATPVLKESVPREGWVLFIVEGAHKRFSDLVFTGTFVLTGSEDTGEKVVCKQQAGEWLHHALIHW